MKNSPIIRLSDAVSQAQKLRKLVGNIPLTSFVDLLYVADLEANAREASTGIVTEAIEDSLENQSELFHFKTKGILAAASQVDELDRGRFRIHFANPALEGIIDGGHNSLAIGRFVLKSVLTELHGEDEAESVVKGIRRWSQLREKLTEYEREIKENLDCLPDAYIPIEIIYPAKGDPDSVDYFNDQILIINAARNNNAQLKEETKAHKKGLYDELKDNVDPKISEQVEWKSGQGGRIKVRDLVALSLIPLSKLDMQTTKAVRENPAVIFSSKAQCIKIYNDIMANDVVEKVQGDIVKIVDPGVKSALQMMRDIPRLYDLVYELFPKAYSRGFGKMNGVRMRGSAEQRKKNPKMYLSRPAKTRFYQKEVDYDYGEGFIYPLIVALRELMTVDSSGELSWKTDPEKFIMENINAVMSTYKDMIAGLNYDPAKVGKTKGAYNLVAHAFTHQLDAEELERLRAQMTAKL